MKALTLSSLFLAAPFAGAMSVATFTTNWTTGGTSSTNITSNVLNTGGYIQQAPLTTQAQLDAANATASTHNFVDVTQFGVTNFVRRTNETPLAGGGTAADQSLTINLTGVPTFDSISLDRLFFAIGGGADGADDNDGMTLSINGTQVFSSAFAIRDNGGNRFTGTYDDGTGAALPARLVGPVTNNSNTDGSEFLPGRNGGWGHDALYDLGADTSLDNVSIAGGGDVTITLTGRLGSDAAGQGVEGPGDEELAFGDFGITFNDSTVPEPSGALLAGLALLGLVRRKR